MVSDASGTLTDQRVEVARVATKLFGRPFAPEQVVNEKLGPGNYERAFDAGGLPSGVYFYRLIAQRVESSTGEFVSTRKMLLIQ